MSRLAQHQRNMARRQISGKRRHVPLKTFTVKNIGTRKTVVVTAANAQNALTVALVKGLAKSITKLVVVG